MFEVKIPNVGESIVKVQILSWHVEDGSFVEKDTPLLEVETEKATVTLEAEVSGKVQILIPEGEEIDVGTVVAKIDGAEAGAEKKQTPKSQPTEIKEPSSSVIASPAAEKIMREGGMGPEIQKPGSGRAGRLTKGDALERLMSPQKTGDSPLNLKEPGESSSVSVPQMQLFSQTTSTKSAELSSQKKRPLREGETRKRMSMLRQSLSRKLVTVKNQTAMLTTFNEADMGPVMAVRKKHQEAFQKKHKIKLGIMSFFTKASALALNEFSLVNAFVEGTDILYHDYVNIGIAVSTDRGLMVPVIKGAEKMEIPEIELAIQELAEKAREKKITLEEMEGGTFTISNGGVFGSMLSTPILNPPQSAILGMHSIMQRPVADEGKVVIKPMMYLALSYDHRIVDGKESVSFLVKVKELLEHPEEMFHGV